ncbi:MAG: 1-acyl-sn-glycerol-3-phosphate acyltransferase [Acidobacteriota bacterium]|nr:1-acyl-sn-glycerol-3-phosphate acyltransferase [Acidobacteriota bacterium]
MKVPPFHWWRTVFFLIPAITVYTAVLGTISLASSLIDRRGIVAHWCARAWSWLILATTGVRVDARGRERLTPGRTYVFVSNHQSIYDIPVLFAALPWQLRIIAKASLGRFPFLGWHLRHTGHILVDRRDPARTSILKQASSLVRQGLSLIVFPEGTRSRDGALAPFKGGSFLLALDAGLPIVPVAVIGSRHVMRKGRLAVEPGAVRLIVHDPIPPANLGGPATPRDAKALANRVRAIVQATLEAEDAALPAPDAAVPPAPAAETPAVPETAATGESA